MRLPRNPFRSFMLALALASVAACGGGSGGGGGSTSSPHITLSQGAVDISRPVTLGSGPEQRIAITLENVQSGSYIRVRATGNGLRNLQDVRNGLAIDLLLQFKPPFELRPGVYNDTVLFDVCTDANCSSVVPVAAVELPVRYTVEPVTLTAALAATSVDLSAFVLDPSFLAISEIDLVLDGPIFMPFIEITSMSNAVVSASVVGGFDNKNYKLRYDVKAPRVLGAGVFDDVITIRACLDPSCVNPFPQSPLILPVRLTVTDHVSGPNGYAVRITDPIGVAMVWDSTRQRIYLSAPDPTGADQAHNVLAFDPVAGQVTATVPVTSRPGALALSDDGAFLYVAPAYAEGHLERLRLPNLLPDLSLLLIDSHGGSCHASGIAVAPARPTLVALGCALHVGGPNPTAVVVFDGTMLQGNVDGVLPNSGVEADPHHVTWGADSSRVFASNVRTPLLYDIAVGAAGVGTTAVAAAPAGGRITFSGGLLYSDNGSIFDPDTLAKVSTLVPQREGTDGVLSRIAVIAAENRIFAIARFPGLPLIHFRAPVSLVSFDLADKQEIASIPLDPTLSYGDLLYVGGDRLALLGERQLILVNGPFVAP